MFYFIVSCVSFVLRQFYLPNPFAGLGTGGIALNILLEPLLHYLTFMLVGFISKRDTHPALRGLLYFVLRAIIIGVIALLAM